jgi:hypothetical protein
MAVVLLEYIVEKKYSPSLHSFTVAIIDGSYMFWLQSSHYQAVYIRSIKGNCIAEVYMWLHSGQDLDLSYKSIYDCYT